jgi:integrase
VLLWSFVTLGSSAREHGTTLPGLGHTAVTGLIERGVPIVQRFAGHADLATTMRYCSIADDGYADRIASALAG